MRDTAQVLRFLLECFDHQRPQALEIRERQLDLALLCPSRGRRNRSVGDIGQSQNRRPGKINRGCGNSHDKNDEQNEREPFSLCQKVKLAQGKIREQDDEKGGAEVQNPSQSNS